jgi:hypothetical protein
MENKMIEKHLDKMVGSEWRNGISGSIEYSDIGNNLVMQRYTHETSGLIISIFRIEEENVVEEFLSEEY